MTKDQMLFDKVMENLYWPETLFDEDTVVCGIIYDNTPKPSWWRHPIKRFKWRQPILGYVDFGSELKEGDFTVEFDDEA